MFRRILLLLCTCAFGPFSPGAETDERSAKLAEANNDFAFRFLHLLPDDGKNIVFSPYSASEAFSLILGGSAGTTRDELDKLF